MLTSKAAHKFKSSDPVWSLLAELPLVDALSNHNRSDEPAAGSLFQTLRELRMSPESMEDIARTLAGFAEEALGHTRQAQLEFPVWLRIFCRKEIMEDANTARTTLHAYHTEQALEHSGMIRDFGPRMNGGWGCFLIEKGWSISGDASRGSHHVVDLYLYREG